MSTADIEEQISNKEALQEGKASLFLVEIKPLILKTGHL